MGGPLDHLQLVADDSDLETGGDQKGGWYVFGSFIMTI